MKPASYFRAGGGLTKNAERDAAIYRAREIEGLSFSAIGRRFDLSTERVRLICAREEKREMKP